MRLVVEHVSKEYDTPAGPLPVLRDASFELGPGETLAVVGPSGSGKSTLLNIIGSLDRPTAGTVMLGDRDVSRLSERELAAFRSRMVGFVFQDHHLLPQCTALENVMLPTLGAGLGEHGMSRAQPLLERVGLADRMDSLPAQLSGGERQRVAIARAMVNGPALLLCDDPTGNLDAETGERIGSVFVELAEEKDVMLVVVTHSPALAGRCSRRMELHNGVLHASGPRGEPSS